MALSEIQRELRAGNFTASEIHKLMGVKGFGDTGETYILEKVAEHFGAESPEMFSKACDYGNEYEPVAAAYYAKASGVELKETGFIISSWCDQAGASPDRQIIGQLAGIEIKCPYSPENHVKHLTIKSAGDLKKVNSKYFWQVQMELAVTGWEWIDFVSFDPRFPASLRLYAVRILPDISEILFLKQRILQAAERKNQIIKEIQL